MKIDKGIEFKRAGKKRKLEERSGLERSEEQVEASEVGTKKRKRPWRQAVRNRAKQARKEREKESEEGGEEHDATTAQEGDQNSAKKKKIKLGKLKRARRRRELISNGGEERKKSENSSEVDEMSPLDGSRFRYLNEKLYTQTSSASAQLFKEDPNSFRLYHRGYKSQLAKWPLNPLEKLVMDLNTLPAGSVIADLGCGEAELAARLGDRFRVHSFDLVAVNARVEVADMAALPLESNSVDVCVYCLSLMGTNLIQFFREAHRILRKGGKVKIAEITSRFKSVTQFVMATEKMGFQLKRKKLLGEGFFIMITLEKVSAKMTNKRPQNLRLEPCLYKKR